MYLVLAHQDLHFRLFVLNCSGRFQLHCLDEARPQAQLLLQGTGLSGQELYLFLLLEVIFLDLREFSFEFMVFFLELFVRVDGLGLFD